MSTKKKNNLKELTNNLTKLIKYRTGIEKPPRNKKKVGFAIAGAASAISLGVAGWFLNKKSSKEADASQNARFNISNPPTTAGTANANKPPKEEEANLSKGN